MAFLPMFYWHVAAEGSSPGAGTIPSRVLWWGVQGAFPDWEKLWERQILAGPGWDQEQRQTNPPTATKEALGKHLETRKAVTRADGTEGPCQLAWELWCPPRTKPGAL